MKPVTLLLCVMAVAFSTFQYSSSKYKLEKESVLSAYKPYFQSWIGGVKDGGSGLNVYFPNLNPNNIVTLDSIYFRGIKGKLLRRKAMYVAHLKNTSAYDRDMSIEAAFKKQEKTNFPFKLSKTDCVISYKENGETKYIKVSGLTEKAGVYYEQGLAVEEIED